MGRYVLLWRLGVPLPVVALIWIFGGVHETRQRDVARRGGSTPVPLPAADSALAG